MTNSIGRYRQPSSESICVEHQKAYKKICLNPDFSYDILCVVRKRLQMTPYKLQHVQSLNAEDREKRKPFCEAMKE